MYIPTRSPLPGAVIFHMNPLSQTLSRLFLFLEAPRRGALLGVFTIANHNRPMVSHLLRHIRM